MLGGFFSSLLGSGFFIFVNVFFIVKLKILFLNKYKL